MNLKRVGVALAITITVYAVALGAGTILYATNAIPTGPTHNDCEGFREEIAQESGIDEHDVPQEELKQRTEECLATHERTEEEAFRSQYVIGGLWPAAICGLAFLLWPIWARALQRQEEREVAREASRLEPGT